MPRKKGINELIQKSVSITKEQNEIFLPRLMIKWGYISESEVFRQAISLLYRKMEPEYLKLSPNQEEKVKEKTEKEKFEAMNDEEYALSLTAIITKVPKTGEDVAIIHWFNNSVKVLSLKGFKDLPKDVIENHKKLQLDLPIQEKVKETSWANFLSSRYEIVL
jgi:Arc/MetJ-type ribon-helix-helix transcriptional regulator